jgi:hypothetical protein
MDEFIKYALIVLGVLAVVILLSKWGSGQSKQCENISVLQLQNIASDIKRLWNLAKQDSNLLVSVMHTVSALSKLTTLQQLDASNKLAKKLNVDFEELRVSLKNIQQEKLHEINVLCPGLALDHELNWES